MTIQPNDTSLTNHIVLNRLDEGRRPHGLRFDDVVVQHCLDVLHCDQDEGLRLLVKLQLQVHVIPHSLT